MVSADFPTDAEDIVINEAAVKEIGWKEPIGKTLATYAFGEEKKFNVIGVLKDFNFKSFHEKISPLAIILLKPEYGRNAHIAVRVKAGDMGNRVDVLQQEWKKVEPHTPFEYSFLDQDFDALFQAEQNLSRIFSIFTGLAIFIACLGLFGLAAFTAEQRTKEIGIRKVLGASVNSVMYLLCKNFLKLILIANLIAWPVSWYAMDKWLQDFAYRTEMNFGIFILAGLLAIAIALLTVGFQALKVAYTNPVDSLRTE
jgi:putative ABC transport system permease protein